MVNLPQSRAALVIVGTTAERNAMTAAQLGEIPLGSIFLAREATVVIHMLAGPNAAASDAAFTATSATRQWIQIG